MRRDVERLQDLLAAIDAIRGHVRRGSLDDGLVFDAVRIRLVEIGEAVKALPDEVLADAPEVDWRAIARSRDQLTHHYWDTARSILEHVVTRELDALEAAARRLQDLAQD